MACVIWIILLVFRYDIIFLIFFLNDDFGVFLQKLFPKSVLMKMIYSSSSRFLFFIISKTPRVLSSMSFTSSIVSFIISKGDFSSST